MTLGENMTVRKATAAVFACAAFGALALCASAAQTPQHRTFRTPEEAVQTLIDVVKAGKMPDLLDLFGADGQELVASSDVATSRANRQTFTVAVAEGWR